MNEFFDMVEEALARAEQCDESRFLADGETAPGVWKQYAPCEEGYTPPFMIEVTPGGDIRLIDNGTARERGELIEVLGMLLKSRESAMHAAASGNSALFDAAQEDVQDAVKKAQALMYRLT